MFNAFRHYATGATALKGFAQASRTPFVFSHVRIGQTTGEQLEVLAAVLITHLAWAISCDAPTAI